MDQFVQLNYPGKYFDQDGAIASSGKVNQKLVSDLAQRKFK
jgi:anhydro-N-acetylmuramic acid kinase